MTEDDAGGLPSATTKLGTTERARDQVAAVHRLLNTERQKAEHDIVLATVFDYLASGPKHRDEIAEHVRRSGRG